MEGLDVVEHVGPCLGPGRVAAPVYALSLESAEEAFDARVVGARAHRAHAADEVVACEDVMHPGRIGPMFE